MGMQAEATASLAPSKERSSAYWITSGALLTAAVAAVVLMRRR